MSLNEPLDKIEQRNLDSVEGTSVEDDTSTQDLHRAAAEAIKATWVFQSKHRRRGSAPHVNAELLHLWAEKKLLYYRIRWQPKPANKSEYK